MTAQDGPTAAGNQYSVVVYVSAGGRPQGATMTRAELERLRAWVSGEDFPARTWVLESDDKATVLVREHVVVIEAQRLLNQ